jgi:hypothetical protein
MSFRILTWNINGTRNQNNGPDQLAEVIRRHRIDLAVLQEVSINGCTLGAALDTELGIGNYTLQYHRANPSLQQRTWTDPVDGTTRVAQASHDENYAIIRRQRANGTYRVNVTGLTALDYLINVNVTSWIGQRAHPMRVAPTGGPPLKKQRMSRPPLVDQNRYHHLGFRRPLLVNATYGGNAYAIFCWHAPQGGGNGGANFSGQDASSGYELWILAGGGSQYAAARVILAGDLNARHAGVAGLGEQWNQAIHPAPGNIHNDQVSHIYGSGVQLNPLVRTRITNLAARSDHVALAAVVD